MADSTVRMPLMVSNASICPVEQTVYRPVGLLSIQLRCYGMLWFDVPTALLRVQRPCSVPGEVVFCSFRQKPQPWQSRKRLVNEALTTGVP